MGEIGSCRNYLKRRGGFTEENKSYTADKRLSSKSKLMCLVLLQYLCLSSPNHAHFEARVLLLNS